MSLIDDYSDGAKLGYKFDWGFKKTIKRLKTNDSFNPYWGMDFSLGSMGGKTYRYRYTDDGYSYGYREDKDETFAHCLQWSFLNLGMDFVLSQNVKLDIHAGGFLSLALLHKYHTEYKYRYNSYYTTYVDSSSGVYDDDYWFLVCFFVANSTKYEYLEELVFTVNGLILSILKSVGNEAL